MRYYLICNAGTLLHSAKAWDYPYHFLLAQVILKNPALLSRAAEVCEHRTTILDNGAYEGELCNTEEYQALARTLKPDCVVLPDLVGHDRHESRDAGLASAVWMERFMPECPTFMYVPCGISREQILDEYDWAINNLDPTKFILGVGKAYEMWGVGDNARREMVKEILMGVSLFEETYIANCPQDIVPHWRIHLLGARWYGSSWFSCSKYIQSFDSIKPCRCTIGLTTYPTRPVKIIQHGSNKICDDLALGHNIRLLCRAYGADIE